MRPDNMRKLDVRPVTGGCRLVYAAAIPDPWRLAVRRLLALLSIAAGPVTNRRSEVAPLSTRPFAQLDLAGERARRLALVADACEHALAVMTPDDPAFDGLTRAARHLGRHRPHPHLRALPPPARPPLPPGPPRAPLLQVLPDDAGTTRSR